MSLVVIPNQPISFTLTDTTSCGCPVYPHRIPISQTDTTQFQVKIDSCDYEETLVDGGLFSDVADSAFWTINNGIANFNPLGANLVSLYQDNPLDTVLSMSQTSVFTVNEFYKITLKATYANTNFSNTTGELLISGIGSNIPFVLENTYPTGLNPAYTDIEIFGFATQTSLEISSNDGSIGDGFVISEVVVKRVSLNYEVGICEDDNTIIDTTDLGTEITPTALSGDNFVLNGNYLTFTINWAEYGLNEGCYKICVFDPCISNGGHNGLINPEFEYEGFGWSLSDQLSDGFQTYFEPNLLHLSQGTLNGYEVVTSVVTLLPNVDYTVTYTISDANNYGGLSILLTPNALIFNPTAGTYSFNYNVDEYSSISFSFGFLGTPSSDPYVEFTGINVELVDPNDAVADYYSNLFYLGSNVGCTLQLNACNDSDSFGFKFQGFSPGLRLNAALKNTTYKIQRNTAITSFGRFHNYYYNREKFLTLAIDYQPDYVLDFLSLLLGFDHFYINGVEYVVAEEEEFTVNYNEEVDNYGSVSLLVRLKEDYIVNKKVIPEGVGCNETEDCECVVDLGTGFDCVVDPLTGEVLIDL
jgi:hypothetical protein